MKQKFFKYPSGIIMSALLLTFVVTSCTKITSVDTLSANSEEIATAKSPSVPSLQAVSLKVTVNAGYNITSVGSTDYTNGIDNVQAVIDKNGNFVFNTNTNSSRNATRTLGFNFGSPIIIYTTPPVFELSKSYSFETAPSTVHSGFIPIQNLGVGANPVSECVSMRVWAVTGRTIDWRLIYHAGFDDRVDSTTAFAYVTRINATQWNITSLGTCLPAAVANKAAYRSGNAQTLYGYYDMPFSFTLTKL